MGTKRDTGKDAPAVMPARVRRFSEELSTFLEGWRYVDSDVRVDGEQVAELLGRIGDRLVFVHHIPGTKKEIVTKALKLVASAADDGRRLGRLYAAEVDAMPLVAVIVEGKTKGLLRRLEALCPDPLLIFVERRLSTTGRSTRFLEELTPTPRLLGLGVQAEACSSETEETKETEEAPVAAPAWEEVLARLDRIDPGLERADGENEVRWSYGEEVLCCVALGLEGQPIGRIGTEGVEHTLNSDRALEVFLDWVLAHQIELTDALEREGLRDVELLPHPSEPLLTPEELAAFLE